MDKESTIHIYIVESYPTVKKQETTTFSGKWLDLEMIVLSKIRFRKTRLCPYTHMWGLDLNFYIHRK